MSDWLKERAVLQRRIKHQRRELRRLNASSVAVGANISSDVYILSYRDLEERERKAFQRGVERGKLEAAMAAGGAEVAQNCANWHDGRCQSCGVQWQYFEVSAEFKCPHFNRRPQS